MLRLWDHGNHAIAFCNDAIAPNAKDIEKLEAPEVKLQYLARFAGENKLGLLQKELGVLLRIGREDGVNL